MSVDWSTLDGAGIAGLASSTGGDFIQASGTLTFPPFTTAGTIDITVTGDDLDEPDEWLVVATSNPINATIGGFFGFGLGEILDDDDPPAIIPGVTSVVEGDSGQQIVASIPVNLSAPSGRDISFAWETLDLVGHPQLASSSGGDFVAASGMVTIPSGQTTAAMDVTVLGDDVDEQDEWLLVRTFDPTNATIGGFGGIGLGEILDDEP